MGTLVVRNGSPIWDQGLDLVCSRNTDNLPEPPALLEMEGLHLIAIGVNISNPNRASASILDVRREEGRVLGRRIGDCSAKMSQEARLIGHYRVGLSSTLTMVETKLGVARL